MSCTHFTAPGDYDEGSYSVMFTAGQPSTILMVPTNDDNITEMIEYFKVMIVSTSMPSLVQPGDPDTSYITINDNEPGEFDLPHMHVVVACWYSPVSIDFDNLFTGMFIPSALPSLPEVLLCITCTYIVKILLLWWTVQIQVIASFYFYCT